MFKWFKKKNEVTEITEEFDNRFPIMTKEEILIGIQLVRKRSKKSKNHVCFFNSYISKKTVKQLKRKKYDIEIFKSDDAPGFKVSW